MINSDPDAFDKWWQSIVLPDDRITADHIRQAWDAGVLFERDACAQVADRMVAHLESHDYDTNAAEDIAQGIRART